MHVTLVLTCYWLSLEFSYKFSGTITVLIPPYHWPLTNSYCYVTVLISPYYQLHQGTITGFYRNATVLLLTCHWPLCYSPLELIYFKESVAHGKADSLT